jgi:hypothetical protein
LKSVLQLYFLAVHHSHLTLLLKDTLSLCICKFPLMAAEATYPGNAVLSKDMYVAMPQEVSEKLLREGSAEPLYLDRWGLRPTVKEALWRNPFGVLKHGLQGRNSDGSTTDLRFPALLCRRRPERAGPIAAYHGKETVGSGRQSTI